MRTAPPVTYLVTESEAGLRLDTFLARRANMGRRGARRLAGNARVNDRRARPAHVLAEGDRVLITSSEDTPPDLDVLRRTEQLWVLNKPAGLPTIALAGQAGDSMAARVAAADPGFVPPGPSLESGIVHRLDTGTSGVLLAARADPLWEDLRRQTREHAWAKTYLCIVEGDLQADTEVQLAIGQHPKSNRRMLGVPAPEKWQRYSARMASSRVEPIAAADQHTLVRVHTRTGLRHQVRIHLASIGHPVINDPLYGTIQDQSLPGHYLHGESIRWIDPTSGNMATELAPVPDWWPDWAARTLP